MERADENSSLNEKAVVADSTSVEADPLAPAFQAVEHGNLVAAREMALALSNHADPSVRQRAKNLRAQLSIDPVIVAVMLASGLLIVILAAVYLHAH